MSSIQNLPAILSLIGLTLDTLIFAPFVLYWTYTIWKQRECLVFRKRHIRILSWIGIFAIFFYLMQRNISFIIYSGELNKQSFNIFYCINCYLYPMFGYGLLYIILYRFWLMYYKTKFAMAQTNDAWVSILNPLLSAQNWWIINKKKYGSGHYLRKFMIIIWILIVTIEGTLWILEFLLNTNYLIYFVVFIDFIIIIIPTILLVILNV